MLRRAYYGSGDVSYVFWGCIFWITVVLDVFEELYQIGSSVRSKPGFGICGSWVGNLVHHNYARQRISIQWRYTSISPHHYYPVTTETSPRSVSMCHIDSRCYDIQYVYRPRHVAQLAKVYVELKVDFLLRTGCIPFVAIHCAYNHQYDKIKNPCDEHVLWHAW